MLHSLPDTLLEEVGLGHVVLEAGDVGVPQQLEQVGVGRRHVRRLEELARQVREEHPQLVLGGELGRVEEDVQDEVIVGLTPARGHGIRSAAEITLNLPLLPPAPAPTPMPTRGPGLASEAPLDKRFLNQFTLRGHCAGRSTSTSASDRPRHKCCKWR